MSDAAQGPPIGPDGMLIPQPGPYLCHQTRLDLPDGTPVIRYTLSTLAGTITVYKPLDQVKLEAEQALGMCAGGLIIPTPGTALLTP